MSDTVQLVSRRERNKLNTRIRLLDAARKLFSRHGVAATTIDELADSADVSRATFFNYFQNKQAVLHALWAEQMSNFNIDIDDQLSQSITTVERIRNLFETFVSATIRHPNYLHAIIGELEQDWGTPAISNSRLDAFHSALARITAAGIARGDVRQDFSAEFLAQMVAAAYLSILRSWRMTRHYDLAANFDEAARFLALAMTPAALPVKPLQLAKRNGAIRAKRK